jgi:hypothetical protein
VTPAPDDEMILESALAAKAGFIVTGDKKDLLRFRQLHGNPIVSPAEFPRQFACNKLDYGAVADLHRRASNARPPKAASPRIEGSGTSKRPGEIMAEI